MKPKSSLWVDIYQRQQLHLAAFNAGAYQLTEVMAKLSIEVNTITIYVLYGRKNGKFRNKRYKVSKKKKDTSTNIRQIRMTKAEEGRSYSS